ncbi:hypothetical protein AB0911_12040 [Streptomyces nigra]|uniref:hypothetical protein n=1 Tax=Streptomyces nigra TaxID=1827580 RepID=UPI0034560016
MSSEQTAWKIYAGLNAKDRRAVDAWRDLGNDMVTSLLNADVLRSDAPRRLPSDDTAEWRRRMLGTDADLVVQRTAEHEAAHAVVARALGVRVVEISMAEDCRSATTTYEQASRESTAIIAAAASEWIHGFRALAFPNGDESGCRDDMRKLARSTGADAYAMDQACRRARLILGERRDEVLALAQQLARSRQVTFGEASGHE